MAECLDVEILLTEYAEGSLTGPEAEMVSEHLATCAACREELAHEQELRRSLSALPMASCPAGVTRRVQNLSSRRLDRILVLGRSGLAAAAVLLLLILPARLYEGPEQVSVTDAMTDTLNSDLIVDRVGHTWTPAELQTAREETKWVLALTTRVMNHAGRSTLNDVFGKRLPRAVTGSLKSAASTYDGGQG